MIEMYKANIQKHYVSSFHDRGIAYHTNRANEEPLPYVKLWELNSWNEEFKTHNEMYVRFTFWLWDYETHTKNTLEMLQAIREISNSVLDVIPEVISVEKEKESIRDAQKPDTKCTVVVYKFKIFGGK